MKRSIILLLTFVLLLSLVSPALAASGCVEAESAAELAELLSPKARVFSLFGQKQTTRLLVLNDTLPDTCGADRVLHYAAYEEYIKGIGTDRENKSRTEQIRITLCT